MSKNVLFIAYFFPPLGGSGVQRSLKFVKYLPEFDYKPIVATVKNGHNYTYDFNMLSEIPEEAKVYRSNSGEKLWLRNIIEKTNSTLRKIKKIKINKNEEITTYESKDGIESNSEGIKERIFKYLECNYYVPDTKIRWYNHAIKNISNVILKENNIDVIFSTSYPYTDHLIALAIKEKTSLPWVADFRDPWIGNKLMMSKFSDDRVKKEEKLERKVVENADIVINAAEQVTNMYKKRYPEYKDKFITITNGFDKKDVPEKISCKNDKFNMSYTGLLVEDEKPETLITLLEEMCNENIEFKNDLVLKFTGTISPGVQKMLKETKIYDNIIINDYVEHDKAVRIMQEASINVLLLPDDDEGKWIYSGKIFDYILAQRPILGIVHKEGVAAELINSNNIGLGCGHDEKEKAKEYILKIYKKFKNGEDLFTDSINRCSEFDRINLTKRLTQCFDKVMSK